jgi:hypothetical protein
MFAIVRDELRLDERTTIVDVGVTPDQTLPESNFFEALYEHKQNITATSIEDAQFLETVYPGVRFVRTDGTRLPFADDAFDVSLSFAVLEHVGTRERQQAFIRELTRVAPVAFLTTPDRSFPVEVHTFLPFIHWLPQRAHQRILTWLGLTFWAKTDNLNLLTASDIRRLTKELGLDVTIRRLRTAGFPSNLLVTLRRRATQR